MHELKKVLAERVAMGLQRRAITKCSQWAERYRVMGKPYPGPWNFKHHPWTREIHDCDANVIVGQKAAQVGFTEYCLNKSFYGIDVEGTSVLYILPSEGDASDFSTGRFDPALELAPHLANIFSDVKNIGHKRAGSASLYVRGSRSRSKLKSLPVGLIIFDELDEMNQENISLATERTSGQTQQTECYISTPTIEGFGINLHYKNSTQEHYFFNCPCCGRKTELIFPECLEITAEKITDPNIRDTFVKCKECGNKLPHESKVEWLAKGEWVPSYSNRMARGFHINQLYSMTLEPYKLAISYMKASVDPTEAQEFYNSKLGLVYIAKGAQVTDTMIDDCIGGYTTPEKAPQGSFITMGIDIGTWLHYEIVQYVFPKGQLTSLDITVNTQARVLKAGKVTEFGELDHLIRQYRVNSVVIDHQPETRLALELANRFYGLVHLCIYGQGVTGKNIHKHAEGEHKVTVDRTSWLDASLGRFKNQRITLPQDIDLEYRQHIKAPVRVYKKDRNGNPVGVYVNGNKDDHHAHARNYAEIALACGIQAFASQDIESPI